MSEDEESLDPGPDLDFPEVLRVTVASGEEAFDAAVAEASSAEAGGRTRREAVRAFESLADLRELLTPRRLEALRSIHDDPPESISALARRLDRPYAVVHADVETLAGHDVVHFEDGPRGAKRPFVPYDQVRVDVPLVGPPEVPEGVEWGDAGPDPDGTGRSG